MSVKSITESLEKLIFVHRELLGLSKQKTEIVKEGSVAPLQALLVTEGKQIRLLEQTELKRQQEVEQWFSDRKCRQEEKNITKMIEIIEREADKEALAKAMKDLTELIIELRNQEKLNQTLLQQSMQFVQLSLDMMAPSIKNMNYGIQQVKADNQTNRSLFDSQV
ncbi:flagellar protein FlgN [Oceanobacillus senegalensis]|uniref:flagellar protein FlgN n=1 Tax=Oceanobacillus senegalensis TaxID=1936063 RepID=UPI0015C4C03B|nr:flagellar protein FlgN [Oceanobacillus senegalensis]